MNRIVFNLDMVKSTDVLQELLDTMYGQDGSSEDSFGLKQILEYRKENTVWPDALFISGFFSSKNEEGPPKDMEAYIQSKISHYREQSIRGDLIKVASLPVIRSQDIESILGKCAGGVCSMPVIDSIEDMKGQEEYELIKSRPAGMKFFVDILDEEISGMAYGTLTTLFGFTGHLKTTLGISLTYGNAKELGYNIAYITLEVPKRELYFNLLSRHCFEMYPDTEITAKRIKKAMLTEDEEKLLWGEIEPDFKQLKGKIYILDADDLLDNRGMLTGRSFENALMQRNGFGGLDSFVFDYINLAKYFKLEAQEDTGVNAFVGFLQYICKHFDSRRGIIGIQLSQANREGHTRAIRAGGRYTINALAEYNEQERSSYNIVALFLDEYLRASGEVKMQLLKHRAGEIIEEPFTTLVVPSNFLLGDLQGYKETFSQEALDEVLI